MANASPCRRCATCWIGNCPGLAGRLVLAVATAIRRRGQVPLIHAAASNVGAIRLYETLGFQLRYDPKFALVQTSPD